MILTDCKCISSRKYLGMLAEMSQIYRLFELTKGQLIWNVCLVSSILPKNERKKFDFTIMVAQVELFSFSYKHQKDISKSTDLKVTSSTFGRFFWKFLWPSQNIWILLNQNIHSSKRKDSLFFEFSVDVIRKNSGAAWYMGYSGACIGH